MARFVDALPTRATALGCAYFAQLPLLLGALTARSSDQISQAYAPALKIQNYRQAMTNFADAQYVAYFDIGSQTVGTVLDTGSFELVVFSNVCYTCGQAGKFTPKQSATYRKGRLKTEQAYGSGSAFSRDASDLISLGPLGTANQTFWEVLDADMPVLAEAKFNAVLGLGPPETPAADAWASANEAAKTVAAHLDAGIVEDAEVSWAASKFNVALQTSARGTVLNTFGINAFSVCIGAKLGSDGYFVWNDTSHLEMPDRFSRVPVQGVHTWTVNLSEVRLEPRQLAGKDSAIHLGCSDGCGAMIDTGTALLVVPRFVVDKLAEQASKLDDNCSNIQELPELVFNFGGTELTLPPDAYIAEVAGNVPNYLQSFLRVRKLRNPSRTCELVVMESTANSSLGPLFILGMPFLRSYYTTFSLGETTADRAIYVAPASDQCTAGTAHNYKTLTSLAPRGRREAKPFWRRMDPSKMLMPHAALKATTSRFVHI